VPNTLQPPCSTGSLTLIRLIAVPHSLVASSTLSPSFFLLGDQCLGVQLRDVGGIDHDDALALVPRLGDEAFGAVLVARARQDATVVFIRLGVAGIDREAGAPVGLVASHRAHVVALIGDREHRLTHLDVVEWWMELVEADDADKAGIALHRNRWVARQRCRVIVRRVFDIVDLAGFERLHRRRRFGDISHSMRSTLATLPPAVLFGGSARAT